MSRKIPASGINLFQLIYILRNEYEEKTGKKALNLSLGNPDGIPPESIRKLQAKYAADPGYSYHTYAEDNNLHCFAEGMVELHGGITLSDHDHLAIVPIAGIKTAGAIMPLACGMHLPNRDQRDSFSIVSNLPAYDVIGTWNDSYLGAAERIVWPLASEDDMRLNMSRLKSALSDKKLERVDLIYVIRPGNPAAVGASESEWRELCQFCQDNDIRLVNDGAYAGLCEPGSHVSLAQVACQFTGLDWIEMYSVSKSYSDPGARLGAIVGSKDFVADFILIKGNTDSGPAPSIMAAYGEFFEDRENAKSELDAQRAIYRKRLDYIIGKIKETGLRPACETSAGFFTLWRVPKKAFGVILAEDPRTKDYPSHEAFNRLVIEETGVVGVHFRGPGADGKGEALIRYAVCDDVLAPAFQKQFEAGFSRMNPEY
ncbi:MAG: aminotransferase class I/II-fold pyridoxal phosphate-dependent enzyme [Kofleriaceae bacterium]|nr:aminotransferase class I/II-fold pyridoxal phosphate-dependent enzyme [Kofleriaceae bacterium]